jgi:CheY-like chemotaxis protein
MTTHVMVVDDDALISAIVRQMLESAGYEVHTALSGQNCIEQLRSPFRGVILMDYAMPGMNGSETIKAISEEGLDKNCVIFMLTGMDEPPTDLQSSSERVLDYIRKPPTRDDLCARIEEAMSFLPPESE